MPRVEHAGAARRRRERRLRQFRKHERLTVAMLLAEMGAREELHGRAPDYGHPLEAAGAQYFAMTPDEEGVAPAASRPAPMEEVRPLGRDGRHCGSGYELVLDATVPQLGKGVDVPLSFQMIIDCVRKQGAVQETPEVQAARDPGERAQRRWKVTPQKHISERISEQIDVSGLQGIPQERITERITGADRQAWYSSGANFGANSGADRRAWYSSDTNFGANYEADRREWYSSGRGS